VTVDDSRSSRAGRGIPQSAASYVTPLILRPTAAEPDASVARPTTSTAGVSDGPNERHPIVAEVVTTNTQVRERDISPHVSLTDLRELPLADASPRPCTNRHVNFGVSLRALMNESTNPRHRRVA
jgi:hypothetical protein